MIRRCVVLASLTALMVACNGAAPSPSEVQADGYPTTVIESNASESSTLSSLALEQSLSAQASRGPDVIKERLGADLSSVRRSNGTAGLTSQALGPSTNSFNAPDLGVSFEGINNLEHRNTFGFGYLPPDTHGDVGITQYVQAVNTAVQVYSKTTGAPLLPSLVSLDSFFAGVPQCETGSGDPIVLYDHMVNRWLITQMRFATNGGNGATRPIKNPGRPVLNSTAVPAGTESYQCVAISRTGDATGSYYRYAFKIDDTGFNDYPKIGVWSDGYYMTFNMFDPFAVGVKFAVAERTKMLFGLPARVVIKTLPYEDNRGTATPNDDLYHFSYVPSDLDGVAPPVGTPNVMVMDGSEWVEGQPDRLQMYEMRVNWAGAGSATLSAPILLNVEELDDNLCSYGGNRNCVPQLGSAVRLDSLNGRMMTRAHYRFFYDYLTNKVYSSLVVNQTVDTNGSDLAGTRWYELRNTLQAGAFGGWSIYQQNTFNAGPSNAPLHTWMGAIAMNGRGDIGLGYSTSSSSQYAGIGYTTRNASDPLGTLRQGKVMQAGNGAQTSSSNRWGDYSAMSVDPVDDCTFWYTTQYYSATSSSNWATRIGSFKPEGCLNGGSKTLP